ncbi:type III secretion system apparatus protein VscT2 [Vibrio cholerae]|uniref:type III secretion system apparatus protein VscT2 n=2 Tax=Vibrio cholerae TaxID=666 RepID=UPI000E6C941C|nr:type III secretion system apparatus protein VscT2 [Vibrio cholerae]EGQ8442533.1 type III secretion system apparatus protein VscT2 [Vibrio cholerae]EGR1312141.1 type III secretion system apparatus protein VscT2 [Vibrio cholerae]NOE08946.1 type III secretion system apparatus protein VscT2 [Vibrio cholerae]NOF32181.1 type III secretion system apparatus protein VscT2 [Vibrio cholerae]RJK82839.1 type III secretion system apparatus protein VscT2 [Vibrio cholerae]
MFSILFPNWLTFAGVFLFLKVYSPTRLYLDNTCCLMISICVAIFSTIGEQKNSHDILWLLSIFIFAIVVSIPFWVSGMVASVVQQLLLLNEQSVQDTRFTVESEALAKTATLIFILYALESGFLFRPMLDVFYDSSLVKKAYSFTELYDSIVSALMTSLIVSAKYIIVFVVISIACGYVDIFFKKASLSIFITPNIKAIVVVLLLSMWFISDVFYIFSQTIGKVYE